MSKSNGKNKKLLFVIIAVVLVIAIAVGVVIATTGNASTPGTKNNDEVEKMPESTAKLFQQLQQLFLGFYISGRNNFQNFCLSLTFHPKSPLPFLNFMLITS